MAPSWLHQADPETLPPKLAHLARAQALGITVPKGIVVSTTDPPALWQNDVAQLLAAGAVIVRSALAFEDQAHISGAGLGLSIPGCRSVAQVERALAECWRARDELPGHRRDDLHDRLLVQAQVRGPWLVVMAWERSGDHIEVHPAGGEPLAQGRSPIFAGPLHRWPHVAARQGVEALVAILEPWIDAEPFGLDLELVVAEDGAPWLVQVRPLTAALHPGWPEFRAAIDRQPGSPDLSGDLILDAEHNPAPLSPAHAWLLGELGRARPHAGGFVALAGWLYVRILPRDLAGSSPAVPSEAATPGPRATLRRLLDEILPAARTTLEGFQRQLADASAAQVAAAIPRAVEACVAMLDRYLQELIPARAGYDTQVADPSDPLCLRDRQRFGDVLPLIWDVASAQIHPDSSHDVNDAATVQLPTDDDAAATLLREWDDHLFALGIAPMRQVYLRAAQLLGLDERVFLLRGDELADALHGRLTDLQPPLARRNAAQAELARLRPPPRITDGRPAGPPPRWLRGFPVGEDFVGTIAQRTDLADLQQRPPPPESIVVLPTLTAPGATVAADLGLRALCCEFGGAMGHGALVARELGLSALLGCHGVTDLADGTRARIDTRAGRLVVLPDLPSK